MMKIFKSVLLIVFCLLKLNSQQSSPCQTIASETGINNGLKVWPKIEQGKSLKINSLIGYQYETMDNKLNSFYFTDKTSWWKNINDDPWSEYPLFDDDFVPPELNFSENVDDNLRWMCGYSYIVDIPKDYDSKKEYPLVVFLHGGVDGNQSKLKYRAGLRNSFYMSDDNQYILVVPFKIGFDWDPKKIIDIIEDVKSNLSVDVSRVHLTGLSMGGRGSFIVASEYPDVFASIMPLSPHHTPYNYLSLKDKVKNIPILISHGDIDQVSSFDIAKEMYEELKSLDAEVTFKTRYGIGHTGWESFYSDKENINWLLSWKKE